MKKSLIAGAVAALLTLPVLAAQVPEGTQLLPATQQVFVRNIGTEPASIDPQMVEESAGSDVVNDLFEGLYTLDGDGKLQAAGALGYELDDTGTIYTFKLRPDAKWSNGEPVTAADYVYGWQRAADPKNASNYAWFIELTGVEEKNDAGEKIDNTTADAEIANKTDVVLTSVAGNEKAIGYISLGALNDTVKAVKVDGAEATVDNVKAGTYKLSRPFNIATKGEPTGVAKDFINFILCCFYIN